MKGSSLIQSKKLMIIPFQTNIR